MSKEKNCSCGKHKNERHNEMTQSEQIAHVKECLTDAIDRLECIKEVIEKIKTD